MRKTFVFLLIPIVFGACKKTEEPVSVSYSLISDFRVPANLQIAVEHQLDGITVPNPTDSVLSANGLTSDQVSSILIDTLYITKNDTLGSSLDFLREVEIHLEGGTESKMLIGTSGELPETVGDSIGLTATTRDLQSFLNSDSVMVWPQILTDQSVLAATDVKVVMELTLESD